MSGSVGYALGAFLAYSTLWVLVAWLACGFFAGHLAAVKGRWGFAWFVWGVLFGPLGLIAAAGLPMKEQRKDT